jgi:t-SNARE syntaxin family protein
MRQNGVQGGYRDEDDDDEDPNLAFEMEQQQQLMSKQDNTLDLIGSTLNNLKRQASNLGQEIGEQVELLGALDTEVDTSQSKLARAMGRMDELVRRSDDRMGGWCVWLLVLVSGVTSIVKAYLETDPPCLRALM